MTTKTLVVSYLPRGDRSQTRLILEAFLEAAEGKTEIERLELSEQLPDLFDAPRLAAFVQATYLGETPGPEDQARLEKMDAMTRQLVEADHLVLATPMHNFTVPAVVKAWIDSVVQKGKTFDAGESGLIGLLRGPAAVLWTAGGIYEGDWVALNHLGPYLVQMLGFMGLGPIDDISAQGMNMLAEEARDAAIEAARERARALAGAWYGG